MEGMKRQREKAADVSDILEDIKEDLQETPDLLALFRQLPPALWKKHYFQINVIGAEHGTDAKAHQKKVDYMHSVLDARRDKSESLTIGDTPLRTYLEESHAKHTLGSQLETLLSQSEHNLGKGQTARVRSLDIGGSDRFAVKYLLTPTAKTITAGAEYDMLREVQTVTDIEREQFRHDAGKRIRVPHPHFFFKNEKIQCYGMQQIEGVTLQELLDPSTLLTAHQHDMREEAWRSLTERYVGKQDAHELVKEMERFMEAVHEICLHGDIKLGNIMVNKFGDLYLIDFGQSLQVNLASEETGEQFENIKNLEVDQFRQCIQSVLHALKRGGPHSVSQAA